MKKIIIVPLLLTFCFSCRSPSLNELTPLKIMSFNIRYDNPDDGAQVWNNRKTLTTGLIKYYQPDIAGLQEVLVNQNNDFSGRLENYSWIGVGRDDGLNKGEFAPIFYLKARFDLIDWGTIWLSDKPDSTGSVGWDAALPRIATWGEFRDKFTSKSILVYNTHFDHKGETAREESAKLLIEKIKINQKNEGIILLGDFNFTSNSPGYRILVQENEESENKLLFDSYSISTSEHYGPNWTFHGFMTADEKRRIDYVFINDSFKVLRHAHLSDNWDGIYPSDHIPVFVEINYCIEGE